MQGMLSPPLPLDPLLQYRPNSDLFSCLFITNRTSLTSALSINRGYYSNPHTSTGLVTDYRDWQIPLGRRFRALKIWFVIRIYGISGLQHHIRRTIELGKTFAELVEGRKDLLELLVPPTFALTVFRVRPSPTKASVSTSNQSTTGLASEPVPTISEANTLEEQNRTTRMTYELINKRGRIYLTSGVVNGMYAIRVVSANEKAEEKYVRGAFEEVIKAAEDVRAGREA